MSFLTVSQVAEKQGVSVQYIRKLLREGKIQGVKVTERLWLIPEDAKIERKAS